MNERQDPTPMEIRIHALNLAASTRREVFSLREGEEDRVAEQVVADARQYAGYIANGYPPPTPRVSRQRHADRRARACGDYPAPCNCDDPETHDGAVAGEPATP